MSASGVLNPPLRPSMRLIPSWDSVLCTIEARLLTEFMKLEKWWVFNMTVPQYFEMHLAINFNVELHGQLVWISSNSPFDEWMPPHSCDNNCIRKPWKCRMSLVHDQAVAARTVTKQQIQLMQAESMGVTRAFLGARPSSVSFYQ